jgi:hypothetical protein
MQLELTFKGGEYSDNFAEDEQYQRAYASMEYCHRHIGWLWDGVSLHYKDADEEMEDGDCHYALFGDLLYRSVYRGWFNPHKNTITFCVCRHREESISSPDMIPERVYQHLTRRFGLSLRWIIH